MPVMRRLTTVLMSVVVLVAALGVVPTPGLAQSADATATAAPTPEPDGSADSDTDTNASAQSGALLSGVVAVQGAEIEGELRSRSFGIRVAQAVTDEERADVVADQLSENRGRLAELEARKERLEEARENGSMSRAQYEARVAGLAAETATVAELTNRSAAASQGLPSGLLESKGINASAITTLANRAENLNGPEVAAIARSIGGSTPARDAADATERRGPPGETDENETVAANRNSTSRMDASERGSAAGDTERTDSETTETPEDTESADSDGSTDDGAAEPADDSASERGSGDDAREPSARSLSGATVGRS